MAHKMMNIHVSDEENNCLAMRDVIWEGKLLKIKIIRKMRDFSRGNSPKSIRLTSNAYTKVLTYVYEKCDVSI